MDELERVVTADYFDYILCRAWERTRYPRDDPRSISVTEVTQCLLYSYLSRIDPRCAPQVASILLGIQGHRIMAEGLQEYGWITEKLVCIERDGVRLCGRVDAYHPDLNVVAEFKFVNEPPPEPYEDHVKQIRIYMAMLGAERGVIVYFSRDPERRTRVFWVHPSRRALDEALRRAKILSEALERGVPPRPEPGRICRFCQYRIDCYKIRRELKRRGANRVPG